MRSMIRSRPLLPRGAHVAGANPPVGRERYGGLVGQVAIPGGSAICVHQDLAVSSQPNLVAWYWTLDRSRGQRSPAQSSSLRLSRSHPDRTRRTHPRPWKHSSTARGQGQQRSNPRPESIQSDSGSGAAQGLRVVVRGRRAIAISDASDATIKRRALGAIQCAVQLGLQVLPEARGPKR